MPSPSILPWAHVSKVVCRDRCLRVGWGQGAIAKFGILKQKRARIWRIWDMKVLRTTFRLEGQVGGSWSPTGDQKWWVGGHACCRKPLMKVMITLGSTWKSKPLMTNLRVEHCKTWFWGWSEWTFSDVCKQASKQADGSWVRHHSARKQWNCHNRWLKI